MMKFYIHCNTEQIYSGLIMNSVTSYSNTYESMRKNTASFLGNEFICLFAKPQQQNVRIFNADDIYFPITLEVSLENIDEEYAVIPFTKNKDGSFTLKDKTPISKLLEIDYNGVFICGELPISTLKQILFEDETYIERFPKPSPDLWFPKELYGILGDDFDGETSIEALKTISKEADKSLLEEDISKINKIIDNRVRYKASMYYALRETNHWVNGDLISNIDEFILQKIDSEDGRLRSAFDNVLSKVKENKENIYFNDYSHLDVVLSETPKAALDSHVFKMVTKYLINLPFGNTSLPRDSVDVIKDYIKESVKDERALKEIDSLFDSISEFLFSSFMNPEDALKKLGNHSVFKALMKFFDSSENDMHMKYGCEGLSQFEKRYAYIWFGLLKGMLGVDGALKCNLDLEYRLEQVAYNKYKSELMISNLKPKDNAESIATGKVFGIIPTITIWYGVETSYKVINGADERVRFLYEYLLSKKDKSIKNNYNCFKEPIKVTTSCNAIEGTAVTEYNTMDEVIKTKDKKLISFAKNVPTEIKLDDFKKDYLSKMIWFELIFAKHTDMIQELCRR